MQVYIDGTQKTLLDVIEARYYEGETRSVEETKKNGTFPPDWISDLRFKDDDTSEELWIQVLGIWKRYRARLEAHFLSGSYSLANEVFKGSIAGPSVDTRSAHPGESWIEVTDKKFALPQNRILMILYMGNVKEALQTELGPKPLLSQTR